tara:strand:- start:1117 stop:4944 length:3828 start_codon:yes stop_codon:yes gene_type:complete
MAFIDFGDFLPSIRDVIEDIPSSVTDILEDTEDSLNTVASSISDVFDAILDKPVQFVLQVGTSILAPHLSPFVNAGVAAANGASGGEILKAALISAASNKIGATATNISNNVLEEINFNPTYAESFSNILGNTVKKVGKGADSGFAALSSLITELQNPIKDFTGQVLQDFEGIQSVVNKAVDQFGNAKNITEAAANVIAEDLARTFSDTTTKYLGEGFGPNVELAVFEAIEAGVKGENVQDAYYASLNKSATNDLAKLAKDPVEKVVDGVLGEFGVIEKKDGTLVAPNNVIVNKDGNAVTKDGKVQTWDGFAGFQTLKNGESIYVFDDGSSISTGFKNNQDFVQAGVDLGSYQSVDQFQADTVRKLSDGYSVKDKFYPKLENLLGNVKINAATDTRTFTDPYSAEIEQTPLNFKLLSAIESKGGSGLDIPYGMPRSNYQGGLYKLGEEVDADLVRKIIKHNAENPDNLIFPEPGGGISRKVQSLRIPSFITVSDPITFEEGVPIGEGQLKAIKEHNKTAPPDLQIDIPLSSEETLTADDIAKLMFGKKLTLDNITSLDKIDLSTMNVTDLTRYGENIFKNSPAEEQVKAGQNMNTGEAFPGAIPIGIPKGGVVKTGAKILAKTGVLGGEAYAVDIINMLTQTATDNPNAYLKKLTSGGFESLPLSVVKGIAELRDQGIQTIFPTQKSDKELTMEFLDKEVFKPNKGYRGLVELTQEKMDEISASYSPEDAQVFKDNVSSGDIVFEKYGPAAWQIRPVNVADVSLGKDPSIYGTSLSATGGIVDTVVDVGLASLGPLGFALSAGLNIAEAAGGAALEIEQQVVQQLAEMEKTGKYTDEYKRLLSKNGNNHLRTRAEMMANAKIAILPAGVWGSLGDMGVARLILKPVSIAGSKFLSSTAGFAGAVLSEFASGVGEQVLANSGVDYGIQGAITEFIGRKGVQGGFEEVKEAGSGVAASAASPYVTEISKGLTPETKKILGVEDSIYNYDTIPADKPVVYNPSQAAAQDEINMILMQDGAVSLDDAQRIADEYLGGSIVKTQDLIDTSVDDPNVYVSRFENLNKQYDGFIPAKEAKAYTDDFGISFQMYNDIATALNVDKMSVEDYVKTNYEKTVADIKTPSQTDTTTISPTLNVFGPTDTQAQTQANNQVSSTVNVDMVGQTGDTQTQTDTQAQTQTQTQTQNQTQTQSMQEVLNNISTKQNQVQQPMGASRLVKETVPPPVDIDYIYDFESIFATPEQEAKFINPLTGIPDVSNREKGVYEDIVNPKNEKDEEEED